MRRVRWSVFTVMVVTLVMTPVMAYAQTLTAVWDPNPEEEEVTSYQVCIGTGWITCEVSNATVPAAQTSYTFTPSAGVLYRVAVRAISARGAGYYSQEVFVSTPSVSLPTSPVSAVNMPISPVSLTAIDPDGGTVQFAHSGLPVGLTLNAATGVITGTPTATGTYTVTIFVSDNLATTSRSFSWTVFGFSADAVTPGSGSGSSQVFSAQYTDTLGATDLAYVYLKFSTLAIGATNTCMVRYDRQAGRLSLRDNAGNWMPGVAIPGSGTQQNSQCSVDFSRSSVSLNGQTLTLNAAMTFWASYAGVRNIFAYASTNSGLVTDWQQRGSWTVTSTSTPSPDPVPPPSSPPPPSQGPGAGAVTPNAGSGTTQTFSAQFTESSGAANLAYVYLKFDTNPIGATNTCMVRYDRATGRLALRSDAGSWLTGAFIPGTGGQQNTQCSIAFAGSSVGMNGQTLTLNVAVTFRSYEGTQNIYSYAQSMSGVVTDWQLRGSWTVTGTSPPPPPPAPAPSGPLSVGSVTPAAGSGASQVFAAQYTDTRGISDIAYMYLRVSTTLSGPTNTCMVRLDRSTGLLSLRDDAGVWMPGRRYAQGGTQTNSQCSVNFASSWASVEGQTVTFSVSFTFQPAYAGPKNIYLYLDSVGGTNTGWQQRGTWTIP